MVITKSIIIIIIIVIIIPNNLMSQLVEPRSWKAGTS